MEKLTIEEKAKRYDEAIDRANSLLSSNQLGNAWIYKLLPELKKSEDEKIRKALTDYFVRRKSASDIDETWCGIPYDTIIAWLEKQSEHANFRNKIQVDDKVTCNEDGVLINLSQLNRVAKKQDEQKPVMIQLKFKIGDVIKRRNSSVTYTVTKMDTSCFQLDGGHWLKLDRMSEFELVERKLTPIFRIGDIIIAKEGTSIEKEPFHIDKIEDDCYWDGENTILISNQDEFELVEQKPTDKVEPKFKVGDWVISRVTNNEPRQIEEIAEEGYKTTYGGWIGSSFEEDIRLWTIQDAKDGDVLVASDGSIFLFKCTIDWGCKHYVALTTDGTVKFNEGLKHFWETSTAVHPAIKEQRDLLFQKMKDAGYEWDAEKKELRKIENEIEIPFGAKDSELQEATYYIPKGFYAEIEGNNVIIKKGEQNTAWSEEDENVKQSIIDILTRQGFQTQVNWFKDRIQSQPKQEWNEEDETNASYICAALDCYLRLREERNNINGQEDLDKARNWLYTKLKSLRPQKQWKPSNRELGAILTAIGDERQKGSDVAKELLNIYQQLKKLREE